MSPIILAGSGVLIGLILFVIGFLLYLAFALASETGIYEREYQEFGKTALLYAWFVLTLLLGLAMTVRYVQNRRAANRQREKRPQEVHGDDEGQDAQETGEPIDFTDTIAGDESQDILEVKEEDIRRGQERAGE